MNDLKREIDEAYGEWQLVTAAMEEKYGTCTELNPSNIVDMAKYYTTLNIIAYAIWHKYVQMNDIMFFHDILSKDEDPNEYRNALLGVRFMAYQYERNELKINEFLAKWAEK